MQRRTLLAGLSATALAGCLDEEARTGDGTGSSASRTVREAFDGEPVRPDCDHEAETVTVESGGETNEYRTTAPEPYPEPPTTFDETNLLDYVEAFEEAYTSHAAICDSTDHILSVGYSTMEEAVLDRGEEVTTVYLLRVGGATKGVGDEGPPWAVELAPGAVVYALDETGAARVGTNEPPRDVDPDIALPEPLAEGELVAAFE